MKEQFYEVQQILSHRFNSKGQIEYYVKWKGYPESNSTWEPYHHLTTVIQLIKQYKITHNIEKYNQKTHQIEKSKRKRGRPMKNTYEKNESVSSNNEREKSKNDIKQDFSLKESKLLRENEERDIQSSPMHMHQMRNKAQQANILIRNQDDEKDREAQSSFSDLEDELEILSICKSDNQLYFEVKWPQQIKWVSNEVMRKYYSRELIQFYQKYIVLE